MRVSSRTHRWASTDSASRPATARTCPSAATTRESSSSHAGSAPVAARAAVAAGPEDAHDEIAEADRVGAVAGQRGDERMGLAQREQQVAASASRRGSRS